MSGLKHAYHPDGVHLVTFNEQWHRYTDQTGKRYISGTQFIGKLFPKFDAVTVSRECAAGRNPKYAGRNPVDIRNEWAAEGERGRDEGTNIHAYAEGMVSGWPADRLPAPMSDRCGLVFLQVDKVIRDHFANLQFVGAEVIIFSPDMGVAGTVDLLMYDPMKNFIYIFDWKNNKAISKTSFREKAFYPIDHLDNCDIAKYSLQTSLYKRILERENYFPGVDGYESALIHVREDRCEIIELEDYGYEISEMVKFYGNQK